MALRCGLRMALASIGLLLLAHAPCTLGARTDLRLAHGRALRQATATAGCNFTADNGNLLSDAFVQSLGWTLATLQGALECLDQVQINYTHAHSSLISLAQLLNISYVYSGVAIDPTNNPPTIPLTLDIHNVTVDVVGELTSLANSLDPTKTAGVGSLQFAMNEIINRLRDPHVVVGGIARKFYGTVFGGALRQMTTTGTDGGVHAYLVDTTNSGLLLGLRVVATEDGSLAVSGGFSYADKTTKWLTFQTINGDDPMNYLIALANNPALNLPFKSLGTRVNKLVMGGMASFTLTAMGNITNLPSADVVFADGSQAALAWGVTFKPTISEATITQIQKQANAPGKEYQVLQKTLSTTPIPNPVNGPTPAPLVPDLPLPRGGPTSSNGTTADLPKLTYLPGDNGFYYFASGTAFLKVPGFTTPADVQGWFPKFVTEAQKEGATALVLDLIGNQGTNLLAAVTLTVGLFPKATYGDLAPSYDRLVGQEAQYAYSAGLDPKSIDVAVGKYVNNNTALEESLTKASFLVRSNGVFTAQLAALRDLFQWSSITPYQAQVCTAIPATIKACRLKDPWLTYLNAMSFSGSTPLVVPQQIKTLVGYLSNVAPLFWPYLGSLTSQAESLPDPYANPVTRTSGGVERTYTQKFDPLGQRSTDGVAQLLPGLPSDFQAQFTKILAVTDGTCGNACATFGAAAVAYSQLTDPAPAKFRFLTFGGTGDKKDASPLASAGELEADQDFPSALFAYQAAVRVQAAWANDATLSGKITKWTGLVPTVPVFVDSLSPKYTQSAAYLKALGDDALPLEFYNVPADVYLKQWYQNTQVPQPNAASPAPSDLPALYAAAAEALATL